ncbi:cell division protein ZapA [Acidobacterium sp. S8]|uniref:cell division protein ZapA n=1 Tax=Acidobacterium sp. S8 TaxID=1641854 RepID=UPI00131CAF06|nr:cell division protein ZapA [Acidobacterium sp. S8]
MADSQNENIDATQFVTVDIYDQTYRLRGQDPEYIHQLADVVDTKMRAVAVQGKSVDSLRVAVLAALNIADELASLEQRYNSLMGAQKENVRDRASRLNGLLDAVLSEERKIS